MLPLWLGAADAIRSSETPRLHYLTRRPRAPVAPRAQQPAKLPTIGFVGPDSPDSYGVILRAFRVGLRATGFIEGQNVAIEYRWAEGRNDRLPALTADAVHSQVAVIVA